MPLVHDDSSPTARALLALELLQGSPGITAERLGDRLGVSERAARRYVAILREAGVPIESVRGPYGGYRVGRGLRLPPLMFTATEALGLVMAVLEAHGRAYGDDPVASAVGKMVRVLPENIARPLEALRHVAARRTDPDPPHPETTATLVRASSDRHRVRIGYALGPHTERTLQVDPWAVVVRHGRWYVLGWSHAADARRMYRIDRVRSVEVLAEPFVPPENLDPFRALEEQMSQGWPHAVDVEIDAPLDEVRRWLRRSLGVTEAIDDSRTRLTGTTENLHWYATVLAELRAPYRVVGGPELRAAVRDVGERLLGLAQLTVNSLPSGSASSTPPSRSPSRVAPRPTSRSSSVGRSDAVRSKRCRFLPILGATGGPPHDTFVPPRGDWTAVSSSWSQTSGQSSASRQKRPTSRVPSQVTSPRKPVPAR